MTIDPRFRREALLNYQRHSLRSLADESVVDEQLLTAMLLDGSQDNEGRKENDGPKENDDPRVVVAGSNKAPSECQVVSESCEWCLLPTPWNDEDDVSPDPFEVVGSPRMFLAPPRMIKGRVVRPSVTSEAPLHAVSCDDDDASLPSQVSSREVV